MKRLGMLFYVKKAKTNVEGTAPIYIRMTVGDQRIEISSKRSVDPKKWNAVAQKVMGNTEEVKSLNAYLKTLEQNIYETYQQLTGSNKTVTTDLLKQTLTGKDKSFLSLVAVFTDHNQQIKELLGQGYATGTLQRYETTLKHMLGFLEWKYRLTDIDIKLINHEFITSFEFYLRSVRRCGNNSAVKYIKNFKKIIRICIANGWIARDPFIQYKSKIKEVTREFLTEEELHRLAQKAFPNERLNQVRDIFLFCCFTGLAYADIKKLKRSEICTGIDGEQWIYTNRQKTNTTSRIPLLPTTLQIMEQYKKHPSCVNRDRVLPVLSNQKMNAYLKEIADVCGIQKHLTFHIARHTFATTVTLSNGVPIESVSKMLGHTNIRTTQHYAKILDQKVSEDMQLLREKFKSTGEQCKLKIKRIK